MEKGIDATLASLLQDISQRDARDASRAVAPLVRCADARLLDTTALTTDQAVRQVLEWYAILEVKQDPPGAIRMSASQRGAPVRRVGFR